MIINEALSKSWSRVGQRATFGLVMIELATKIDDLMVISADVSTSAGLDRFKSAYPEKYLDVGIAEQNMMGIATGLASEGYSVFTTSFAPFQTMRCCEQIRVNLGYMGSKVCMVGLASGLVSGTLGNTHCCFEDVGVLRSIPGITIITPADCAEAAKAICAAQRHPGPVYLRLTGSSRTPIVYSDDYDFEIGKAVSLKVLMSRLSRTA
jgi:transketolase